MKAPKGAHAQACPGQRAPRSAALHSEGGHGDTQARQEGAATHAGAPPHPHVNGVPLCDAGERLDTTALRQRACTELLRQAAIAQGLLAIDDPAPQAGAISEAAATAIERLLAAALRLPEPNDETCRRHHAAHAARYAAGERVRARHVLFAVTPGVDVNALRRRAWDCLLELRGAAPGEQAGNERFSAAAAACSNCPSGRAGGHLGWLTAEDCAPEFARALFGRPDIGVLPHLVHSRFGLHVVEVLERVLGAASTFEQARAAVVRTLRQRSFAAALSQYLRLLASQARMAGVHLETAPTPLAQ